MGKDVFLIFPNNLFDENDKIDKNTKVYIIEHPVYFTLFKFHKMKLVLHRATMKKYKKYLEEKYECKVKYIEYKKETKKWMKDIKEKRIDIYDPVDHKVMKDILKTAKELNKKIVTHETPLFITKLKELKKYKEENKDYNHDKFYKWQRKRLKIMIKDDDKPYGGKWSFDKDNREPFPDNFEKDQNFRANNDKYTKEAIEYVKKNFKDNPGNPKLYLPIDNDGAKKHVRDFFKNEIECYGKYQDAVDEKIIFGCHSIISPLLNIGLIKPEYIVKKIKEYQDKRGIKLNNIEGFTRQVIGWREYARMLYSLERKKFENKNHFLHRRKLNDFWFKKNKVTEKNKNKKIETENATGIHIIDNMINKAIKYGYLHHIERLMYIGNFMLITRTKPEEAFRWFMEMFIDSYNWVMYSNVYGMSQYSAGKIMMTRPYFSSSSYIERMSGYKKSDDVYIELDYKKYKWSKVWDGLYYNFIRENKEEFKKNYAIARQVYHWNNKSNKEKKEIEEQAKSYMRKY